MREQHIAQLQVHSQWEDPIVIVGAGPVGMSAALGLAYFGIPSLVLDDAEGTAIEGSRAIFMERHTLEILGAWSPVGRQMAEQGMTLTGGRVFFRQQELYKTLNAPPDPAMRYPRFVNMPQNLLERLQYQALREKSCCEVHWQHKVTGIAQNDEGVNLEVTTPQGSETIHAQYVLAADGPRSTMRRLLHLNFPGESRDHHFLILDVRMQLETPRERWFWFDPPFNPGRTALLHPQPDSIYRIDYQLRPDEDLEAVKEPVSLHQRIIATVGDRPYEVVWKSIYTYQQRVLDSFRCGCIFFLGDAAHLMSPFGGRGLNSGVQDVANLVWKLALVRGGRAPDSLLNTYNDERRAAALENLRLTDDTMRFLVPQSGLAQWRRNTILRLSLPFKPMRRYVNAGHMSNPFTYSASPIVIEDTYPLKRAHTQEERQALNKFRKGPVAGALAPIALLEDSTTSMPISLYDCFGTCFVVLYFCSEPQDGVDALSSVRDELLSVPIAFYLVTPQQTAFTVQSPDSCVLYDREEKASRAYNAWKRTLYLVRPDRHIAARRFTSDTSELLVLLRRSIGEAGV